GIVFPRTEKGNPSFTAGNSGWMPKHPHWLPQLIVKADKYNNAAVNFLETYILGHVVRGRVHAEIHPHRSDEGGTRSLRFSYSNPPLQLMPAHDEELAPLIRGVFLPEEGEIWAKPDISQQEFRFIVHYAARHNCARRAKRWSSIATIPIPTSTSSSPNGRAAGDLSPKPPTSPRHTVPACARSPPGLASRRPK